MGMVSGFTSSRATNDYCRYIYSMNMLLPNIQTSTPETKTTVLLLIPKKLNSVEKNNINGNNYIKIHYII